MISYEALLQESYISPSVGELLFGKTPEKHQQTLHRPGTLPKTAYNICLLYSALIQAYVIGKAIQKECTIFGLGFPPRAIDTIKYCWSIDSTYDLAQDDMIFSFLLDWAGCGNREIMGENAAQIISAIRDTHKLYTKNARVIQTISEQTFLYFLASLPLLHSTQLDFHNQKIIIDTSTTYIETKCSPYISFWNTETERTVDRQTPNCYILTSIDQGDRNGEPCFNIAELNSHNTKIRTKQIRRQIANNENLLMVCKAVGIQTDWYPIDDCWCDLAFLKRITVITKKALTVFWEQKLNAPLHREKNVIGNFREMYKSSELYNKIREDKPVPLHQIDAFLYELYINYGVFKSMWGLFLDEPENKYSRELFELFMKLFVEEKMITEAQKREYENLCSNKISMHIFKLEKIVPKDSYQYEARCREIKAEWRAFYVLQAAGISTENLFADKEEILSIDDYYDMVKNPVSSLKEDLRKVLSLLTAFYGAMLACQFSFKEKKFQKAVWQIQKQDAGKEVGALFDELIEIVQRANNDSNMNRVLGRKMVCDPANLREYRNVIIPTINDEGTTIPSMPFNEKEVFISYSHEDQHRVSAYVERWQKMGFRVFFDKHTFRGGDDWRKIAGRVIESDACEAVLVFMSKAAACSEAVSWELECAQRSAAKKFGQDPDRKNRYIVAINLESEPIPAYLKELDLSRCEGAEYARTIRKIQPDSKVYYDHDMDIGSGLEDAPLDKELRNRLFVDNDNGIVVQKTKLNRLELSVANFYAYLKYGDDFLWREDLTDDLFDNYPFGTISRCIFPMVISVKETKIKRDNITLAGYEMIQGKGRKEQGISYILSSKRLSTDEYYCIPNYRSAEDCSWMVEPFLVNHRLFTTECTEGNDE